MHHRSPYTPTHRIARAYCGEVADPEDVNKRFVSLTTLGSPHYPPRGDSFWAKADQTRGLLSYGRVRYPGVPLSAGIAALMMMPPRLIRAL